jgi:hypothetical protein
MVDVLLPPVSDKCALIKERRALFLLLLLGKQEKEGKFYRHASTFQLRAVRKNIELKLNITHD